PGDEMTIQVARAVQRDQSANGEQHECAEQIRIEQWFAHAAHEPRSNAIDDFRIHFCATPLSSSSLTHSSRILRAIGAASCAPLWPASSATTTAIRASSA